MNEDKKLQHPNVYNTKLPRLKEMEKDRVRNLEEIRVNLSAAILKNDTGQCVIWTINLHKYIILYGLAFTRYGQSVSDTYGWTSSQPSSWWAGSLHSILYLVTYIPTVAVQ